MAGSDIYSFVTLVEDTVYFIYWQPQQYLVASWIGEIPDSTSRMVNFLQEFIVFIKTGD